MSTLKSFLVAILVVLELLHYSLILPFIEGFRLCPCCTGICAWIPMKELAEGTMIKRDMKFGIPLQCTGNFECRCCGLRQEFEQTRLPPAVKKEIEDEIRHYARRQEEFSDYLRNRESKDTQSDDVH